MYKTGSKSGLYPLIEIPEKGKPKRINERIVFYPETGHQKGKQAIENWKVISPFHFKDKPKFITNWGKADKLFYLNYV